MQQQLSALLEQGLGAAPYCFWLFCAAFLFFWPLEKRAHWLLRAVLCAIAFTLFGLVFPPYRWNGNMAVSVLWYTLAWLLISLQCRAICRISWSEAFFCGTNAMLTEHIGSSVQILLAIRLSHGGVLNFNSNSMLAYVIVYMIVWALFGRRLSQGQAHFKVKWLSVATITVASLTVTVVLSMLLKANIDPDALFTLMDRHTVALLETGQLYAICFCISILTLEYVQQRELIADEKLTASHELWTVRQKQYEMSRETIEAINRKCHDMKHQVAALMAQDSDSGEKRRYAEEIEQLIEIYDLQVNTKNEALNTILMEKGLYCSTHGIRWNCAVDDTALEFVEDMDLYVLLGNALDNAVEAVRRVEDRRNRIIQLQISRKGRFACIRLENSFQGEVLWQDGLPATTKADTASHGIGLRSIRTIAEKYQGELSVSTEDGAFILSVLLPIPSGRK